MPARKKSSRAKPKPKTASRARPAARSKAASARPVARPKAPRAKSAASVRPAAKGAEGVVYSDVRRDAALRFLRRPG
jgi:hypothetical protein